MTESTKSGEYTVLTVEWLHQTRWHATFNAAVTGYAHLGYGPDKVADLATKLADYKHGKLG